MKNVIYLRINNINGMKYVGQTNDFRRRETQWRCLKWTYANKYLSNDREQYGLGNWSVEILAEVDTREEAWELEQYYIEHYNTIYPNGYNLAKGGGGNNGCHHSELTKKKMSEIKKGKIPKANPPKQVYQYTLDGELVKVWESVNECGRNEYKYGHISECCRGERNMHKGYKWSYVPL